MAFELPVWLDGWSKAWQWLKPPRMPGALAVMPFSAPKPDRLPPHLWLLYGEQLALRTNVEVDSVCVVRGDDLASYFPVPGSRHYDEMKPRVRALEDTVRGQIANLRATLHGQAGSDPFVDGVTLWMRPSGRRATETHVAWDGVVDAFGSWLVKGGFAQVRPAPPWYTPPPAPLVRAYCRCLCNLTIALLTKNRLVSTRAHRRAIDRAHDLAAQASAPPQCRLFPLTMTLMAARAGDLDEEHRQRALDLLRGATDPDDLVACLAPAGLRALGDFEEANRRVRSCKPSGAEHQVWLESLADGG